ncbi:MHYT domain-containing protein [Delftia acidovorans]|uniref:MHYT domain-containing protein n=1 Tax=Delftia acidovorans TaxID=80866 RepID=UPI000BD2BF08|nr:MHYT domain-containing protein [Delftia acidovorans]SOE38620.1 MHYT domain-containing protein, NO-binding membrane sensor [Delftia acidovorans]
MNEAVQSNEIVETSWRMGLVVLSYGIAVLGSFVALTAAQRIRGREGISWLNLLAAGTALGGIGVWSMHFTGMLALNLGMGSGYSMVETLLSLCAAVAATSVALAFVARRPESGARVLGAGTLLGLGVAFMHYLGMYGMRFPGFIVWSVPTVLLSVGIAVAAASAALWLSFRTSSPGMRALAAAVMGAAVCSMHYTGMAAADFVCISETQRYARPQGFAVISALDLPVFTVIVAIGLAALIGMDQLMQQRDRMRRPLH